MTHEEAVNDLNTIKEFFEQESGAYPVSLEYAIEVLKNGAKQAVSDDLIRRSDAIEAIEEVDWYHQNRNKDMVSGANSDEHQAWYKADDIYKALEGVPSADRPQGEWIVNLLDNKSICSLCGANEAHFIYGTEMWYGLGKSRFCPYCGAKMKGADDE